MSATPAQNGAGHEPGLPDLSPDQVQAVLQSAVDEGFSSIPDEIATEMGRYVIRAVMAERQAAALIEENEHLRKRAMVMATDIAVLQSRLAGLDGSPVLEEG